jgi:putative phosphotransacetylase
LKEKYILLPVILVFNIFVMRVPVGISNRHIHLGQADADKLFGKNHEFKVLKELSQPGQFAYEEVVTLVGPKGSLAKVRVLWPCRKETQVEVSLTDTFALGVMAPIQISGDLEGTPGIKVVGPEGEVELSRGVIVAQRHLHISVADAKDRGLKNKEIIKIRVEGPRAMIFDNVSVRVDDRYVLDCHIDTDEANAAALKGGAWGEIVK